MLTMFNKKQDFIEFTIQQDILRFGNFTLKSGRDSPYFFNTGLCNNGLLLSKLANFYSDKIKKKSLERHVNVVFLIFPQKHDLSLKKKNYHKFFAKNKKKFN